ncbi:hypothetical protein N9L49_04495 [Rhodospirillales bacterium]|nr:hypothetical protein [Rhodospirillales bacterium]
MADENTPSTSTHTASDDDVKLIAGYPGPAILVDAAGSPIVSNAKCAGLEKALSGGAVADIEALIASAIKTWLRYPMIFHGKSTLMVGSSSSRPKGLLGTNQMS